MTGPHVAAMMVGKMPGYKLMPFNMYPNPLYLPYKTHIQPSRAQNYLESRQKRRLPLMMTAE